MPLAWRLRPVSLAEFTGQEHLLGEGKPLRKLIEKDRIVSLILYGPPGTGKTALAGIIAKKTRANFISLNAVTSGIKEIRDSLTTARHGKTILFIDEIHRFNRIQQDALLPHVESGEITLIGTSTHNPFFALVSALASRSMIFEFNPLRPEEIRTILNRAFSSPDGINDPDLAADDDAIGLITTLSDGDARRALNILEISCMTLPEGTGPGHLTLEHVQEAIQRKSAYYDEDDHYDTVSAFIKSMRGSDPDAAIYWLSKMIDAGEDPMFIARRIVICASEDVGNADPAALTVAVSAMNALEKTGLPEGAIPLAQAAIYIACAPKSNASYMALKEATDRIRNDYIQEVPGHLRDSHYTGAKRLNAGKGYKYPHDYDGHFISQKYMVKPERFYRPSGEGYEKTISEIMESRRKRT
ncbi:replication-associated recombination protein A [bacterium BMS3Bbin05]|nr:replication-associated recombination protein A [bacterium BMS3Bbin05]